MEHLSQEALQSFSDESLRDYTISVEQELAKRAIFLSQIRQEWSRRYPE